MKAFFGMLIIMGVSKRHSLDEYWSNSKYLRCDGIASVMTRNRFQIILRYFHLADPADDPRVQDPETRRTLRQEQPLYNIQKWLNVITDKCQTNFIVGREICLDEE
ncbi:uncharacterized protein LOC144358041 [Saccoglossus kowalevskii]